MVSGSFQCVTESCQYHRKFHIRYHSRVFYLKNLKSENIFRALPKIIIVLKFHLKM